MKTWCEGFLHLPIRLNNVLFRRLAFRQLKEEFMDTSTLIASVAGVLSAVLASAGASWVSYRALRSEYLSKRRLELISKQMGACEALWAALASGSRSRVGNRVVIYRDDHPYVVLATAQELCESLTTVFTSPAGLYYSRSVRHCLFELRDFLENEFLSGVREQVSELEISKSKAKNFDYLVQSLRISIRKELGVENLQVGQEDL
jgi:hypothetical protein